MTSIRTTAGPLCALVALVALGLAGCGGDGGTGQDAGGDSSVACSGAETSCSGTCTDLQTDAENCGACGTSCASGEACMAGACRAVCPSGTTACGNACVATAYDPDHCGACDNACADGEFCVDGGCRPTCPLTVCGDACVDTAVTSAHCGSCDEACDPGQICVEGACELACAAGEVACDGACADPMTDRNHCGATGDCAGANAGTACGDGEICVDGACTVTCGAGLVACDGACVDTANDPDHCGACDGACADGEFCVEGGCRSTCPLTVCGDACVDTAVTAAHCGSCDSACDAGEICVGGACELTCAAGQVACEGACVDPMRDRAHCGATGDCADANAGEVCADGEICVDGACTVTCGAGLLACDGTCTDPMTDRFHCGAIADCAGGNAGTACAAGEVCVEGACALSCPGDQIACGGACVDPRSDRTYCGASGDCTGADAGTACAAGEVCSAGTCAASCGSALTLCGDACVDTDHDPMHCGDCATVCPGRDHALSACDAGTCRAVCEAGFGDCDGDATNGCETSLSDDALHCGVCGNACRAGVACTAGICGSGGHAVLIGHDFFERSAAIDRLLGNAVFLSSAPGTLRVLEYTELSDNTPGGEASNARAAIMARATALGRTLAFTTATSSAAVLSGLLSADVFVVYEQEYAVPSELISRGTAWASALQSFVRRGGVVVVMDYNGGLGGTREVLNPSGLIVVTGSTDVTASSLSVNAADPVAAGVASPYVAADGTLAFTGVSPAGVVTVSSSGGQPVVLHRSF